MNRKTLLLSIEEKVQNTGALRVSPCCTVAKTKVESNVRDFPCFVLLLFSNCLSPFYFGEYNVRKGFTAALKLNCFTLGITIKELLVLPFPQRGKGACILGEGGDSYKTFPTNHKTSFTQEVWNVLSRKEYKGKVDGKGEYSKLGGEREKKASLEQPQCLKKIKRIQTQLG